VETAVRRFTALIHDGDWRCPNVVKPPSWGVAAEGDEEKGKR